MHASTQSGFWPQIAVVIPACDEESCIGQVLEELQRTLDRKKFVIAVGVNDSHDRTAEIARACGALVAETSRRGYGHGCQAAIDLISTAHPSVRAYLFCAGDGASDPADVLRVAAAYERGCDLVLGTRTKRLGNWRAMTFRHVLANFALGVWCGMLGGRWFTDLGPLRAIDRELFERIDPREWTFGWTIETQVAAAKLGAAICEVTVRERSRISGRQKVSGVSWRRTLSIGCSIVAAGLRTARRSRGGCAVEPAFEGRGLQPQQES
jgi:glycosyltransferase involved in cell wall biosynthesis